MGWDDNQQGHCSCPKIGLRESPVVKHLNQPTTFGFLPVYLHDVSILVGFIPFGLLKSSTIHIYPHQIPITWLVAEAFWAIHQLDNPRNWEVTHRPLINHWTLFVPWSDPNAPFATGCRGVTCSSPWVPTLAQLCRGCSTASLAPSGPCRWDAGKGFPKLWPLAMALHG